MVVPVGGVQGGSRQRVERARSEGVDGSRGRKSWSGVVVEIVWGGKVEQMVLRVVVKVKVKVDVVAFVVAEGIPRV